MTKLQNELTEARELNILLFEENKKLLSRVNELIFISEASFATSTWPMPDKDHCLITSETTVALKFKLPEAFQDIKEHQSKDPDWFQIIKNINKHPNYTLQSDTLMHTSL